MAKATKSKTRISLNTIIDENKKYDELVKVSLDGVGFTEVYRRFSPQKIEALLEDFSDFIGEYESKIDSFTEKEVLNFLNVFILLHFSTLVEEIPKSLEEKLDIFEKILNSEIAENVAEAFDKNEVAKITDRLTKKFEALKEIAKTDIETKNKIREYVKNSKMENKEIILSTMFPSIGDVGNGE